MSLNKKNKTFYGDLYFIVTEYNRPTAGTNIFRSVFWISLLIYENVVLVISIAKKLQRKFVTFYPSVDGLIRVLHKFLSPLAHSGKYM